MKKFIFILFFLIILIFSSFSLQKSGNYSYFNLGASLAAGGRYDPVRMCVITPAGVPGGPAFEILAFACEYRFNWFIGIGGYLPIGRPIIFGTAFRMLQFIPEGVVSFHFPINNFFEILINGGFGGSFHYGPSFRSDFIYRGPSFFAAGPRFSCLVAAHFTVKNNFIFIIGLKPYFEYLISNVIHGPIVGGEIDFQFRYAFKQ
jgi:hypothetical protein